MTGLNKFDMSPVTTVYETTFTSTSLVECGTHDAVAVHGLGGHGPVSSFRLFCFYLPIRSVSLEV